jgi:hypothetical protein
MSTADDLMDFGVIPMDNITEVSKLDMYLAQPLEKVSDVIVWWWDHRAVFPKQVWCVRVGVLNRGFRHNTAGTKTSRKTIDITVWMCKYLTELDIQSEPFGS